MMKMKLKIAYFIKLSGILNLPDPSFRPLNYYLQNKNYNNYYVDNNNYLFIM